MHILYNVFIALYRAAAFVASFFNQKAKLWLDGRKGWENRMKQAIHPDDKLIWVHCSSLGEFEQGRPVMEKIKKDFPEFKLAVSFFSPSGYEVRKEYVGADYIFYLPADSTSNARKLIQLLHPEILVLVKYEYWYNLLGELKKAEIPVIVISALIKGNEIFLRSWGKWFKKRIDGISHFFVQNEKSKQLLEANGIRDVSVSGDTRFDRVKEIRAENAKVDFVEKFKGDSRLIIAGSTWPEDEELLVRFVNEKLPKDWKLLIAPHNIDAKRIRSTAEKMNKSVVIYSTAEEETLKNANVLFVDSVGLLNKIYAYADISFVGGGYTKTGVHNVLEPAVFGVPVLFGPTYDKYLEVIELLESKGGFSFSDYREFEGILLLWITDEKERKKVGKAAERYIYGKPDSVGLIMDYLGNKLS